MLEGLEISVKTLSDVLIDNETFRFDSEYFSTYYLEVLSILRKVKTEKLSDITDWVTQGPNPSFEENAVIPCLTGRNINHGRVNYSNADYISEIEYSNLSRFQLKYGDTLITLKGKGSIGKIGFVTDNRKCIFSRNIGIVRPTKSKIDSAYLNAYILSKYGQSMVLRGETGGTGQSTVTCSYLKSIDIPRLHNEIEIGKLVIKSEDVLQMASKEYLKAEAYLLECLGMKDFAANPNAYNTLSLKDSFLETGRFDAEYYFPKYEDYCKLIQSYSNGYELLKTVCDIVDINYTPEDGQLYKYVELADIGKSGEITGCDVMNGEDLPTRARRIIHTNDVIVSSIEGSLDSCALVTDDYDGALCSTGFYVLQSSKLNPETLLTLFKSLPIQQLMKKGCSGTILTAINKFELEKLPIPIIRTEIQQEIAKHIRQSFVLRKEALQLLEKARLTVEQAIENGGGNLLTVNKLQNEAIKEFRTAIWLLLVEIGIVTENNANNNIVTTTKKLSDSFLCSERFDAEYYQPKYDYLFNKLSDYENLALGDLVDIHKSIEPGSDAYCDSGIPFVRVSNLSKFGLSETSIYLDKMNYADVMRPIKDTILLSKDGSVGIAYKIEENLDIITSGAILHLKIKSSKVLPDYLTLVINSIIVQLQAERDAGGSIIQHWKPSEIEKVRIPILPLDIQTYISKKIQHCFLLRKESLQLLEQAKSFVEQSIETCN